MRCKGEVLPDGRIVRPYKGSLRPPGIDPDVWARLFTTRERQQLINDYEQYVKGIMKEKEAGNPPEVAADLAGGRGSTAGAARGANPPIEVPGDSRQRPNG